MANRFGFVDPNTYAKNVLKSIKYVATETAKGVNPTLTNYISDNVSAAKDMYYAVKDFKGTVRNELGKMVGEENLESLKDVKKNILDDLRTGKFYNAEREDAAIGAFAESMGMTGFDFDDEDFDFDNDDNKEEESSSSESSEITGAIHGLGNQLSYHQLITSEAVAGKIAGNATKNSKNMMLNNQRLFGMMNNSLSVINSSILNLHTDIVKPVNSLALNADTFFKQTSEEMAKQTKYLEDIKNLLTDRFSPKSTDTVKSRKQTPWEKIMGDDLPDLGEWGKFATRKFMEEYDLDSLAAVLSPDMINMLIKGGGLASPIATALTMSLTSKIQNGPTGKALDRTVSIIRDGMMKIAGRMHEYAKGDGFFATIAKFLDITPKTKPKMDFGNYNKGRVDWTGKDSKALREVIPTYLANIEALLSGKEAKVFNYETGRFITASRSVNDFKKKREEVIGNASRGMKRELINDFISEDNEIHKNTPGHISYTENSRAVRSLSKDYDKLMSLFTLKGVEPGRFHKTGDIVKFCVAQGWIGNSGDQSKYPMNYKSIVALDRLIFKKKSGVGKLYNGVYQGQLANAKFIDQISETDSTFSNIANGSGLANTHKYTNNLNSDKNNIFNVKDNLGNNVFFYLQDFYKNIRMMVDFQSAMRFDLDTVRKNVIGGKNVPVPPNQIGDDGKIIPFDTGNDGPDTPIGEQEDDTQEDVAAAYAGPTLKKRKSSHTALSRKYANKFRRKVRTRSIWTNPGLEKDMHYVHVDPNDPSGINNISRSVYGFDMNQYNAPDNIGIYAGRVVKNKPVTSEEVTERGFTVLDSEGRDVYNPETKQYEKPKAESRGGLLFRKNKAKEESTVGSFIVDRINDLLENFMFGDLGTRLKEQVDEDGGFFGYMLNLPSRISDAIYDFPERFAKKADDLWKKFQETNFGEKYIKANKDILASFVKGTAQYADRQVDGTFKYIKEHFKIGKPQEEKPFKEYDKLKRKVKHVDENGNETYTFESVAPTTLQIPQYAKSVKHKRKKEDPVDKVAPPITTEDAKPEGSYKGGQVRKSGMVSVSEGELIIPAKYNPMYHGALTDEQRKTIEHRNYKAWRKAGGNSGTFFGSFAEGGTVEDKPKEEKKPNDITEDQAKQIDVLLRRGRSIQHIADSIGVSPEIVEYIQDARKNNKVKDELNNWKEILSGHAKWAEEKASHYSDEFLNSPVGQAVKSGVSYGKDKIKEAMDYFLGDDDIYKDLKKTGNEIVRAAKVDLPKVAAAGSLGALAGAALTGSGFGLLGGLVLGSGAVIVNNSTALSEALFGKYDENKNLIKKGILPKGAKKFITEKVPNMGKAGALGAILGTIGVAPGGIMGGFALGAGIELVKDTETFKSIMFGKTGIDGKTRNGGILGSIQTRVVDPLIEFTDNGIEKIKDFAKKNFFSPIKKLFDPLTDWVKGKSKSIMMSIVDSAKDVVKRTIGEKFDALFAPVATAGKWIAKRALGIGKAIITAPFKLMGAAGDALQRHNINKGYSSLSAEKRAEIEENSGNKFFTGRKKVKKSALTDWELKYSGDKRDEMIKTANAALNGPTVLKQEKHEIRQNLRDTLVGTLPHGGNGPDQKLAKSITKLMNYHKKNNNDYSDVIDEINNSNLDQTTKESMVKKIEDEVERLNKIDADIKDYDEKKKTFFDESGLDISKMSKKELRRTRMQLRMDAAGIHKKKTDAAKEALKNKANVTPGEATIESVDKLDIERNTILDNISDKISGILESLTGEKKAEEATSQEQQPATATEAAIDNAAKETSTTPAGVVPPENKEETAKPSTPSSETKKKVEEETKKAEEKVKEVAGENTKSKKDNDNATVITTDTIKEVMRLHNSGVNDRRIARKLGIEVEKIREIIRNNRAKDPAEKVAGNSSNPIQEGGQATGDNADSGDGNTKTVLDDEGNPIQYTKNTKGEWIANLADAATNAAIKAKRKAASLKNKFFGMFVGGNFFDKFKDIFGINKTDEDGNKKSSILDFVKDKASGLFSKLLSGITSFLGPTITSALGTVGKTIVANLPTILGSAGALIGLSYLGKKAAGTDKDSGMRKGMDATERQEQVNKMGILGKAKLGMDRLSIAASGKKMTTYEQDDHVSSFFSDRLTKRLGTNALLSFSGNAALSGAKAATAISKIPGIGKVAAVPFKAASKVGDVFKKGVEKITQKAATKVIDPDAVAGVSKNAGTIAKIADKCKGAVRSVLNFVAKKLGKDTSWIDDAAEQIAQAIGKAGSKVTGVLNKISGAIYVGQIALAVEDGFEDARAMSILGIIEKPTITERCVAAAVNGINYAIPGIGGIISSTTIFNIVFNVFSRIFKKLTSTLANKRADAKETVEAYNQETGHTYNVEEYVYNVLGKSTTQDKFKSFVGKTVTSVKNLFTGKNKDTSTDDTKDNLSASKSNIDLNKEASGAKYGSGSGASQKAYQAKLAKARTESSKKKKKGIFSFFNGSGSNIHTTQKGNFTKFGNSTIDQDGCGPAVASTVLKAFGKSADITDTAKYAEKMGYVAGSTKSERGTNASYFGDILGRNGIDTKYTDNQSDINSAISSGKPTILLGEDDGNKSKTNSPFGPNPHYVVARGKDKSGNVIVDDPELKGTALYKKNILQKTKLGVVAGGDSDVDSSTASTSNSMDVSGIINTGISAGFNAIANKVGGTFGTIINTIFSGFNSSSSSSSSDSSGYSYGDSSSSGSGYVYTGDSPFPICTEMPKANDPYISYYNKTTKGGQSTCILGNPMDPTCTVLSNCVGWACGRFNHIYSIMKGEKTMKYRDFHADAGQMYALASKFGLQTGSTPQAGAIMVWASTIGKAGHVAVVEKVVSSDELMDSESGFSAFKFKYRSRKKGSDGNWGGNSKYRFLGFVYNPAVQEYYASHNSVATPNAGSESTNAKIIWNNLKKKGMSETGISGLMGCWQNESRFNPINLEDKFEKKYGNDKQYTSYVDSNNKWPDAAGDDVGYGLAQWTGANNNPNSGNRKHNLLAYAKSKGTSVGDLNTQVDFAYDELKNSGKYTKAYNNLMSAKTPADAAAAALGNYEMPGLGMEKAKTNKTWYPKRKDSAEKIYSTFHGTGSALDRLDQEAIAVAARRSGSGSSTKNTKIPITHDFTNPNHSSTPTIVRKKALSRGSASDIDTVATTVNTSGLSDIEKLDIIIKYLEQITQNTTNNSSLPAIASILNGIINNMGSIAQLASSAGSAASSIGDISNSAQDIQNNIMEQLQNMRAKVEALASTP